MLPEKQHTATLVGLCIVYPTASLPLPTHTFSDATLCLGPNAEAIPHVSSFSLRQMAHLLYTNALHNLRNPQAVALCQQSLVSFQYFAHVFPHSDKVLHLLDICLAPYVNSIQEVLLCVSWPAVILAHTL